ncbi:MAG: DNA adenine methylase [Chloroflexi bacterium]|nr:DNA adenine methylase [Chloroflexota bacterium]
MARVRSPLRYPGGKSRAATRILKLLPPGIAEYREPFLGGGSVFLAVKQAHPDTIQLFQLSDLYAELICFWRSARDANAELCQAIRSLRARFPHGRALHQHLRSTQPNDEIGRAVRFFILNRISFSGATEAGGYSQHAFEQRFTPSSLARLQQLPPLLRGVRICAEDYERALFATGEDVFLFLDPPYHSTQHSRLYGARGALHPQFDHERFADRMRQCPHRWLITYDDSSYIRHLFRFAEITSWSMPYGMNNVNGRRAARGAELFIRNY